MMLPHPVLKTSCQCCTSEREKWNAVQTTIVSFSLSTLCQSPSKSPNDPILSMFHINSVPKADFPAAASPHFQHHQPGLGSTPCSRLRLGASPVLLPCHVPTALTRQASRSHHSHPSLNGPAIIGGDCGVTPRLLVLGTDAWNMCSWLCWVRQPSARPALSEEALERGGHLSSKQRGHAQSVSPLPAAPHIHAVAVGS